MSIKTASLGSVSKTFASMGLAIERPSHPRAYSTCCHAYTAKIIGLNIRDLPDDYSVVLLGHKGEVLHSIIMNENDDIVADTQQALRGINSHFDVRSGVYNSKMYADSHEDTKYEVIARLSVGEFKQRYLSADLIMI